MEINCSNPLIGKSVQCLDSPKPPVRIHDRGAAGSNPDRLARSVRSLETSHIENLIRSTADVREDRVDQVRSRIESGTYNVKAEQIADKIIGGGLFDEII